MGVARRGPFQARGQSRPMQTKERTLYVGGTSVSAALLDLASVAGAVDGFVSCVMERRADDRFRVVITRLAAGPEVEPSRAHRYTEAERRAFEIRRLERERKELEWRVERINIRLQELYDPSHPL